MQDITRESSSAYIKRCKSDVIVILYKILVNISKDNDITYEIQRLKIKNKPESQFRNLSKLQFMILNSSNIIIVIRQRPS